MSIKASIRQEADNAFSQARRRVFFQRLWGVFTGHQQGEGLLSFSEVRHKLKIRGQRYLGVQTIPIEKIVGSTGRYNEFNRAFLPTQEFIRERWKGVYQAAHEGGFPPIDVYQIGDVYFVRDGHHRVSVLKELGAGTVEATVTRLDSPIPLSPDIGGEELDRKAEYASFLRETGLDEQVEDPAIEFTLPGQHQKLLEHIAVHRYYLGLAEVREIPYAEAVARWYTEVYAPVVQLIREEEILADFPERTEADLYLWIIEHRHYLSQRYGHEVPLEQAAAEFSQAFGTGAGRKQLEAETSKVKTGDRKARGTIAVFGSGTAPEGDEVLLQAERLGRLLAEAGFALISGGYGGTMEAASRGATQAGGTAIGVTMDLFTPPLQPNSWLTRERRVKEFFPRLRRLTAADGFVVLKGGIGTLTEATLTWSLLQTRQISPRPFILVGESWRHLFEAFRAETFMREGDFALAALVSSVDQAVALLLEDLAPAP